MTTGIVKADRPRAELIKLDGKEGTFQMVRRTIDVPADLIYKIGGGRGGYLASAFDLFARETGISFDVISTEPIYEKGNIRAARVRVRAEYHNASGKLVADEAECYIDVELLYHESRAKWERKIYDCRSLAEAKAKSKNPEFVVEYETFSKGKSYLNYAERPKKVVVRDNSGNPVINYLLPDDAEVELWENFMTLRKNAIQKAQTVARRTLVQRAIAVKNFDATKEDAGKKMSIYGFVQVMGREAEDICADELFETPPAEKTSPQQETYEATGDDTPPAPESSPSPDSHDTKPSAEPKTRNCESCGKPLSEKDLGYCPRKNSGRFDCYTCWQKSKEQ